MSSPESADPYKQDLLHTPSWVIASVCTVFILCSLIVERGIFFIGHVLTKHKQAALSEALEKIKEELMLMGFISLALTVGQRSVTKICIPASWSEVMLQCSKSNHNVEHQIGSTIHEEGTTSSSACAEGKVPFILLEGIHQLHILLFTLVVVHVVYSVMIMALGMYKVHQWKAWEERANEAEALSSHGPMRLTRDVTFVRRHAAGVWSSNSFLAYVAAFFQQFFHSVSETDYCTLRHGFIKKHMLRAFNFHRYILETLEDDFKYVVGISPILWGYTIFLILVNIDGLGIYYWASFIPLVLVLAVGTKLRRIIPEMAVQIYEKHAVIKGLPDVNPADEFFWFRSPKLILYIIHFILFQDAFELSLHFWSMFTFPSGNCLYQHRYLLIGRLILGVLAQVICGFVMLPLYALVSQMGSQIRMTKLEQKTELADLRFHDEDDESTLARGNADLFQEMQSGDGNAEANVDRSAGIGTEAQADLEDGDVTGATGSAKDEGGICLHRKMSYVERVARGVQGISYHTLTPPNNDCKGKL